MKKICLAVLALALVLASPAWASEDLDAFDNMVRDPGTFRLAVYLLHEDFPKYILAGDSYDYHAKSYELTLQGIWYGPKIAGRFSWGLYGALPYARLEAEDEPSQNGFGDAGFGPFLYLYENHKSKLYISFWEIAYAPTGKYDAADYNSPGLDAWRFRHQLALGWYPAPFGVDWRVKYMTYLESDELKETYSDYIETDFVIHYTFAMGLTLGVAANFHVDVSSMQQDGQDIENTKGHYYSAGLNALYPLSKNVSLSARWLHDLDVDNNYEGDTFYLRMVFWL